MAKKKKRKLKSESSKSDDSEAFRPNTLSNPVMKAAAERLLRLLEEEELEHLGAIERLPDEEQDGETENDRVKSDN